jgi:hypothetical protein
MKLNVYTIFDSKSLIFNTPFFAVADGAAKRMVADLAADLSTTVGRHPTDYILYRLATYDDNLALFDLLPIREHVADVISLVPIRSEPELFPEPNVYGDGKITK